MASHIADHLIQSTDADLDCPAEYERAHLFFYDALMAVVTLLPTTAQIELHRRGPTRPNPKEVEASRVALWTAIEHDKMCRTRESFAIRAALFAFHVPESGGPLDAIVYFCEFFQKAHLPQDSLIDSFHHQWPPRTPGDVGNA